MKSIKKQMNFFKLFSLLLMSIIIVLTPFFAHLNKDIVNTVFASSVNYLNAKVEEEKYFEVKEKINLLHNKVYYKGTVEDDFSEDSVIIVLNEEETHKFKTYTPEDFAEIDCVSVRDLTSYTVDYVKEQIENKKAGIKNNEK